MRFSNNLVRKMNAVNFKAFQSQTAEEQASLTFPQKEFHT